MTLEVSTLTEAEINEWTLLAISAFQTGIGHLLTGPPTTDNITKKNDNTLKSLREQSNAHYLKLKNVETGEIIAGASWYFFEKGNTEEELDKMFERRVPTEGYREDYEPMYEHIRARRRILGTKPHIYLHMLFTGPSHQRQGASARLLKWGVDKADELGLVAYLEASVEGRGLYEKHGFKVVEQESFNMADFGRPDLGTDVNCIMLREPIRKDNGK